MPKRKGSPANASVEELADFYDQRDTTELEGELVEVEPVRHPMVAHSIRFDRGTVQRIRAAAARRGVGVTQLMRQWIEERLAEEEATEDDAIVVSRKALVAAIVGVGRPAHSPQKGP